MEPYQEAYVFFCHLVTLKITCFRYNRVYISNLSSYPGHVWEPHWGAPLKVNRAPKNIQGNMTGTIFQEDQNTIVY